MSDLISRQATIDALDAEITVTGRANAEAVRGYVNLIANRIKRLPSAQSEQRWIPVSERLPEERQRCLVTYGGDLVGIAVFTNDLYRFDRDDFIGKKGVSGFVYYDGEYGCYFDFEEVTAWTQLPEPYREEAE